MRSFWIGTDRAYTMGRVHSYIPQYNGTLPLHRHVSVVLLCLATDVHNTYDYFYKYNQPGPKSVFGPARHHPIASLLSSLEIPFLLLPFPFQHYPILQLWPSNWIDCIKQFKSVQIFMDSIFNYCIYKNEVKCKRWPWGPNFASLNKEPNNQNNQSASPTP